MCKCKCNVQYFPNFANPNRANCNPKCKLHKCIMHCKYKLYLMKYFRFSFQSQLHFFTTSATTKAYGASYVIACNAPIFIHAKYCVNWFCKSSFKNVWEVTGVYYHLTSNKYTMSVILLPSASGFNSSILVV